MALLCSGPGVLCALASVFTSLVYVRNRHLPERIMQDEVANNLPFNLWTFLSLPSLYFAWSFFLGSSSFSAPAHTPFNWDVAILGIPVTTQSTCLSLLVTLILCSLVARNFQVLSRVIQPVTTPNPLESLKPMDLSSPSVLESTEVETSAEKVLGLIPTAAHAILVFSLPLLAINEFYNDPITRISLIIAITAAAFAVILHLQASLQLTAYTKLALVLPVSFLALSALAFLFSLLTHFWTDYE